MMYYDPRKPKPWPIRILNRLGITNDTMATNISILTSVILLIFTALLYANLFQSSEETYEEVPESVLLEMERDSMNIKN